MRVRRVCSSWLEISIDSDSEKSFDDIDLTCRNSTQFARLTRLFSRFAFSSCSFHTFVWLRHECKNVMRRTDDSHTDFREIVLRTDLLNCSDAHTAATRIVWNAVWALWAFVSHLLNENVAMQNAFATFLWIILKKNLHSSIRIYDIIYQRCRLWITSACIARDQHSCDKSQSVF
jgi:hypothetical protein